MAHQQQVTNQAVFNEQRLVAAKLHACKKCGAPGFWHNVDPKINPGCYAPEKVTMLGMDPVGPICPNCGAKRPQVEEFGEIWSHSIRPGIWPVLKAATFNAMKSLKRRRRR